MKTKIKSLFIPIIIGLLFSACKKDKEAQPSIYGKWGLTYFQAKEYINGSLTQQEEGNISENHNFYFTLEFKMDGKYILDRKNSTDDAEGTFKLVDNKLYIKEAGQEEEIYDHTLSIKELVLKAVYEETSQGITERTEETMKFKKL